MIAKRWSAMTDLMAQEHKPEQPATGCEVLSWEICPRCWGLAAIGRESTTSGIEIHFDCAAGCEVGPALLREMFTDEL